MFLAAATRKNCDRCLRRPTRVGIVSLGRKTLAPTGTTTCNHFAATDSRHATAKSVAPCANQVTGLKGTFHLLYSATITSAPPMERAGVVLSGNPAGCIRLEIAQVNVIMTEIALQAANHPCSRNSPVRLTLWLFALYIVNMPYTWLIWRMYRLKTHIMGTCP